MLEVDSSKIEISSKLSRSSELSVEHYQQLLLLSLGSVFPQKTLLAVSCVFQIIALLISLLQMVLAAQFTNNLSGQLNQLQFSLMAYLLIASIIVFLAYLCYIYGIFQPMTLYNADLLNPHLLFYSFKGDMRSLGDQFQDIKRRAEKYFKLSNSFGIYFSDPSQNIWKCVLGIIVNSGQKQQVSQFLEQNAKFKERKLQSTRFIGTSFPYVNALTFIFLMHSKIGNFRKMLAETKVPLFRGSFQIYHFNFSPKRIELVNPLNNLSQFQVYQEE